MPLRLRPPHWYECSQPDVSRSAPQRTLAQELQAYDDDDFVVDFKTSQNQQIETAEDAVSLTDVLVECRRLRKEEEENIKVLQDEEQGKKDGTKDTIDAGTKPKGKNPFDENEQ